MSIEISILTEKYYQHWLEVSERNNTFFATDQVMLEIENGDLNTLNNQQKKLVIKTLAQQAPEALSFWLSDTVDRIPPPSFTERRLCILISQELKLPLKK